MSFLAISNESIFLKTQGTRLGAIVAPNKGLEQALQKYRNAEKWFNFQKFQLKRKIVKHFARPKQRAALRKLFSPTSNHPFHPHQIRSYHVSDIFKEIYRIIQTFDFKLLQECSSWASRTGVVQIFFLTCLLENL